MLGFMPAAVAADSGRCVASEAAEFRLWYGFQNPRHVLGPAHNELLSLRIEISVTKWRRVDGVEQLLQFRDMYFDDRALWWKRVTR